MKRHPNTTPLVLQAALNYAAIGWSVFPLRPDGPVDKVGREPGKKPLPGTHGFEDATLAAEKLEEWFKYFGRRNIGIPTGRVNGIFVIDVDINHGQADGEEELRRLEAKHGPLPETLTQLTPRGGRHLFFRYHGDWTVGSSNSLPDGLDSRGDGGYVVGSPSVVGGKRYEWVGGQPNLNRIADPPDWLRQYLEPPKSATGKYIARSGSEWAKLMLPVSEGGRHERIKAIAGYLMRRLQPEVAEALIHSWNECYCDPPLADKEVLELIDWTAQREAERRNKAVRHAY